MQPFRHRVPLAPDPDRPSLLKTLRAILWFVIIMLCLCIFMLLILVPNPLQAVTPILWLITPLILPYAFLEAASEKPEPPDPNQRSVRLLPQEAPELFACIEEARAALGAPGADIVVINGDANAHAVQYPDCPGRGQTLRVLEIGVVYLFILSRAQLKTVLLHEFTHFRHPVDGKSKVWTSAAALASQRDEHRADASTISLGFKQVMAESLTSVHVFAYYLNRHYWPSVVPPTSLDFPTRPWTRMEQWFLRRLRRMTPETWLAEALAEELIAEDSALAARYRAENTPYNTHPTLTQRLAALGEPPRFAPPTPEQRAWLLLPPKLRAPVLDALDREWSQHNHQAP